MGFKFFFLMLMVSFAAIAQRMEFEYKLAVPADLTEKVNNYALAQATTEKFGLPKYVHFTTGSEIFRDVYYDTKDLRLHESNSSLRFRRRVNLTNSADRKNGRMLIQFKISASGEHNLLKSEVKYRARNKAHFTSDSVLLAKIKKYELEAFAQQCHKLKLEPTDFVHVLTLKQLRRRVYALIDGVTFMTFTLDQGQLDDRYLSYQFSEIEIEINEILFTGSNPEERKKLQEMVTTVKNHIKTNFPTITENSKSKYSLAVKSLEQEHPLIFWLKRQL